MKLAQSSFVYFNYPLQEAIRRLHAHGYQGIEIWGGRPHMYRHDLADELDDILALLDHLGMSVPNFIPAQFRYPSILCSTNETVRRDSVQYIKSAIDNALRVRSPSVSLCAGMALFGTDLDEAWAQLRRSIEELLDYTEDTNLKLLIEPAHRVESNLILTVTDALRMIQDVKSLRLGVLLDTGHAHVNGEDLAQDVRALKDVPFHIHIDDNNGDSDAHMIPGAGTIDFGPFAAALREIGYQGFVSAELGWQYTQDPDAAVIASRSALAALFAG